MLKQDIHADIIQQHGPLICKMVWEFLSFLWDYALSKDEYLLVSYQDGPVDITFFEEFNGLMKRVPAYDTFTRMVLLEKLSDVSPSHKQCLRALHEKHGKGGYFFLKALRLYHKSEEYKKMHGLYPLEELVYFKHESSSKPLILTLLSFLDRAVPKFHKGLDLGDPNEKGRHTRLEDRLHKAFKPLFNFV